MIFGAVTTLILIFLTIMFFNYMENQIMETKGLDEPVERVAAVIAGQKKELSSYNVVDAKKNLVAVPIDTAMAMIVEQRTKDPNPKINPALQGKPADAKDAGKTAPNADAKDASKEKKDAPKAGAKGNEKH